MVVSVAGRERTLRTNLCRDFGFIAPAQGTWMEQPLVDLLLNENVAAENRNLFETLHFLSLWGGKVWALSWGSTR